jgi:hypothetical protein
MHESMTKSGDRIAGTLFSNVIEANNVNNKENSFSRNMNEKKSERKVVKE